VCVQSGTTTEKNMTDYSKASGLNIKPVVFEKLEAAENAYFTGRCIAYTTDASGLASTRNKVAKVPADHIILPELISKEPWARWCAAVTTSGFPLSNGPSTVCSKPKNTASPKPTWTA